MTVDDVYKLMLYAVSKNRQQGYLSPSDFNTVINQGSKSYASFLMGSLQQYAPGRPTARVELGQNSVIRQRLTPIIYGINLTIDSTGFVAYPGDYSQADAMWSIYGITRIRFADQHKLDSIYHSVIDPIALNPIYVLEDLGFRFYPQNTGNARLKYVRQPPDMIWGYVDDANGRPVYSAAHSTQPIWDEASLLEIVVRALMLVGVNLNVATVMQYSNDIKQSGQ